MGKIVLYMAILIGIYLVLSSKNSSTLLTTGAVGTSVLAGTLQGRRVGSSSGGIGGSTLA